MPRQNKRGNFPRLYLSLLGLCALVVLLLSANSFLHEKDTFESTSMESVRVQGEKLAREIERHSNELASKCLHNKDLYEMALQPGNSVTASIAFGSKAREISREHPIADGFFLLSDNNLYFPRLKAGKPYSPLDEINSQSPQYDKDFAALYRKAEKESDRGNYHSAVDLLEKCSGMQVSDELKSRSLDLMARVYFAAKNPTNAVRIWNRLEDKFADCLNEFHVPYALAAAIQIDELEAGRNTDRRNSLKSLYTDLINGRWLLSEEVVLELKERLEKRLGHDTPADGQTTFLQRFQLARLVEKELKANKGIDLGSIYAYSFSHDDANVQLYYTIPSEKNPNRILVMSVDSKWVSTTLLNQCRRDLGTNVKAVSDFIIQPVSVEGNSELTIPFENIFPFLELRLPEGSVASGQLMFKVQLGTIGIMTVLTLTLLVVISILIIRSTKERMAMKMRSDFLSHVSHELKTPLTLIQLYTETLQTDPTLPEEDRRYSLEVIAKESTHLLNLIENLLQLSGTENTPEQFKLTEGDLGGTIEKTANVCTEWLRKQGITLQVKIATALPHVLFDREKVTRAFLNLVDNARKYGDDADSIEVEVWSENNSVILEVRDHGPGIPESERKMIFNQFYRGSNTSERRGVGLGLFLVNETMKAHNGSVNLETKVGEGSTFRLIFPVHKVTAPGPDSETPA